MEVIPKGKEGIVALSFSTYARESELDQLLNIVKMKELI
jgi:hypothetical protein